MSIGMGEGEDKANAAIYQALHHPLLEIDSVDQAAGVLIHFTGGDDLALHEVGDAVTKLRETLREGTDLVLGASTDPNMDGRAQAILIVTGLGGRPVASTDLASFATEEAGEEELSSQPMELDADLDLPTFLRRRMAYR